MEKLRLFNAWLGLWLFNLRRILNQDVAPDLVAEADQVAVLFEGHPEVGAVLPSLVGCGHFDGPVVLLAWGNERFLQKDTVG